MQCSDLKLSSKESDALVDAILSDLDLLPVPNETVTRDASTTDVALLVTVGGPPRAESIVQAHV